MKIKPVVTICLGVAIVIVFFVMIVGLLVPDSVLKNLSLANNSKTDNTKIESPTNVNKPVTPDNLSNDSSSTTNQSNQTPAPGSSTSNSSTSTPTASSPEPASTASCGSGGTCTLAKDVTPYTSQSDCRMAINSGVSGQPAMGIYKIPSSFLSTHAAEKSISRYCGMATNINLKNAVNKHSNGSSLGGSTYDQWIKNFYYASL